MRALGSETAVSVRGVTTVLPVLLKGEGWDTSSEVAMVIVRLPWDTAQLEILIREVATMVLVRSLMMMRAGISGVISMD